MIESVLDQGVWEFRDDIGGELGSDGFHEEIPFLIIEVLIEFREVGVVGVMSRSEESRSILGIDGAFDQIDRFHVLYVRHGRSLGEGGYLVNAEMRKRNQMPDARCQIRRFGILRFGVAGGSGLQRWAGRIDVVREQLAESG